MPKRSIPGSIYVRKGQNTLLIKYKGKQYTTGLKDTKENRKIAEVKLRRLFLESQGLAETQPKTIRGALLFYERSLIRVNEHTKHNYLTGINRVLTDKYVLLTPENIEMQVINFMKLRLKDVSKNTYLKSVQVFLNYCSRMGWMPIFNVKKYAPRIKKQQAQSYTEDEVNSLLRVLHGTELAKLIEFMVETGARMVDALTLEWHQVDFINNKIIWVNKINKDSEPRPANPRAMEILQSQRQQKKPFSWSYNSTSRLSKQLHKAFAKSSIIPNGRSFQEFRVTFRMRMLAKGVPEVYTQWLLRHKTFQVTGDFYTNFDAFGAL